MRSRNVKLNLLGGAVVAALLALPLASSTASAQGPIVIGGGLVNVQIGEINVETGDILSDNVVVLQLGAALQLAANVCNVSVGVIAQQIRTGDAECEADPDQFGVAQFARITRIN